MKSKDLYETGLIIFWILVLFAGFVLFKSCREERGDYYTVEDLELLVDGQILLGIFVQMVDNEPDRYVFSFVFADGTTIVTNGLYLDQGKLPLSRQVYWAYRRLETSTNRADRQGYVFTRTPLKEGVTDKKTLIRIMEDRYNGEEEGGIPRSQYEDTGEDEPKSNRTEKQDL